MNYCAQADYEARYPGELEQLIPAGGGIDTDTLNTNIADASEQIDVALSARYDLPLPAVPGVLVRLCVDIARYYLYDPDPTENVTKKYDDARATLKQFARGELTLGNDTDDVEVAEDDDAIVMQSAGSVWGRADSQGFI
jgi:phage gp36-like protein